MLSTHPDPVVTRRTSDRPHRVRWLIAIAAAVALCVSSAEAQCPPGSFIVSGSVQGTGGVPLGGYDIDILDAQGNPLDLSQDFTLANGTFTLTVCQVIPAGFYTVVVHPPTGSNYFVGTFPNEIIQQGAVLGPFVLTEGVRVTGTVRTETGVAIQSADLQFSDSASGVLVQYSNESTNALGQFDVLIDPLDRVTSDCLGSGTFPVTMVVDGEWNVQYKSLGDADDTVCSIQIVQEEEAVGEALEPLEDGSAEQVDLHRGW